jgi:hypothetical protein
MRVERLDYQREFLKLATALNKTINSEIAAGEEKSDMQVKARLSFQIAAILKAFSVHMNDKLNSHFMNLANMQRSANAEEECKVFR